MDPKRRKVDLTRRCPENARRKVKSGRCNYEKTVAAGFSPSQREIESSQSGKRLLLRKSKKNYVVVTAK